jgi:hypothetical protein
VGLGDNAALRTETLRAFYSDRLFDPPVEVKREVRIDWARAA